MPSSHPPSGRQRTPMGMLGVNVLQGILGSVDDVDRDDCILDSLILCVPDNSGTGAVAMVQEYDQRMHFLLHLSLAECSYRQIKRKLPFTAVPAQAAPQVISSTLQAQHATFMSLAAKAASVDVELQKVKVLYTQLWCAKTGSMRDPFNHFDQGRGFQDRVIVLGIR
ncbi:hypothetical protein HD554DRAFT_116060 [Boletus coccyginus]|nr:hypothetical protein HD554DRAFT_116060 [Boletus coccyginus]